jgi:hypothetical protein
MYIDYDYFFNAFGIFSVVWLSENHVFYILPSYNERLTTEEQINTGVIYLLRGGLEN